MKYRKKSVVIEAIEFTGKNFGEIYGFTDGLAEECFCEYACVIPTLEGNHIVTVGDFIIKGVKGEFYPCKPDVFMKTYEKI